MRSLAPRPEPLASPDDAAPIAQRTQFTAAETASGQNETVLRASGNKTLLRTWSMLEPYARTYVTAMVPGMDLIWLGDRHQDILEALEAGDPELAAETMRHHAQEAEQLVMQMDDEVFAGGEAVPAEP